MGNAPLPTCCQKLTLPQNPLPSSASDRHNQLFLLPTDVFFVLDGLLSSSCTCRETREEGSEGKGGREGRRDKTVVEEAVATLLYHARKRNVISGGEGGGTEGGRVGGNRGRNREGGGGGKGRGAHPESFFFLLLLPPFFSKCGRGDHHSNK